MDRTPVILPGKSMDRGAWQAIHGVTESDMTKHPHTHTHTHTEANIHNYVTLLQNSEIINNFR